MHPDQFFAEERDRLEKTGWLIKFLVRWRWQLLGRKRCPDCRRVTKWIASVDGELQLEECTGCGVIVSRLIGTNAGQVNHGPER